MKQDRPPHLFFVPQAGANALWGAVDDDGNLVIPPIYKSLQSFHGEYPGPSAFQTTNERWGYIGTNGKFVHAATLDQARGFVADELARFKKDGLWGFIKPDGNHLIEPEYEDVLYFLNGYAAVKKEGLWSYIDTNGQPVFDKKFYQAGHYSQSGLAAVRLNKGGKFGFINTDGEWAIEPQFDKAHGFFNSAHTAVSLGKKWGIIDSQGRWVLQPTYYDIYPFEDNGFAKFRHTFSEGGIIRQDGQVILDLKRSLFERVHHYANCDLIESNDYYAKFYDLQGQLIDKLSQPKYKLTSGFDHNCHSLALTDAGGLWYQLNADGDRRAFAKEVLEPYFISDGENTQLALSHGSFLPVVLQDRSLAYVDALGQIVLRARTESKNNQDVLVISDSNGKEMWRHNYSKGSMLETHGHQAFLNQGDFEFGFETPTVAKLKTQIAELIQRPAQPFTANGFDINAYGGDDYGAGVRLAYASYHYFDHSGIYHHAINWPNFNGQLAQVKNLLIEILGQPLDPEELENEQHAPVDKYFNSTTWQLEQGFLVLYDDYYEDGDVDHWAVLNLLLLPTEQTIREQNNLPIIPIKALNFANQSSAEITAAVAPLKRRFAFDSGIETRDQVIKILSLAQSGQSISTYDYLRTQHALLLAAFDGSDELQLGTVDQLVALVEHVMGFIEQQGLDDGLLTAQSQFRRQVYREAANMAAWQIRESNSQRALNIIQKAMPYVRDQETYLYDTQVRILLNLGHQEQAFIVVKKVLTENPWYEDFRDFYDHSGYQSWLKKQHFKQLSSNSIPTSNRSLGEKQNTAVHAKSNQLAVYWNDELQLYDILSGQRQWQRKTETYDPFSLKFNQNGGQLISSGWDQLSIWDTASGQRTKVQKVPEGNSECAGLATDGLHYYYDQELALSNTFYIKDFSGQMKFSRNGLLNCNASKEGGFMAINESPKGDEGGRISLVDLNQFKVIAELVGNEADSYDDDMFFVQNNSKLLVRDYSNFHLWDIGKQAVEFSWDTGMDVDEVVVTPDFVLAVDGDEWELNTWFFTQQPGNKQPLNVPQYARGDLNYRGFLLNSARDKYIIATTNEEENLFYVLVFDFKTHRLLNEFITPLGFGEMALANNDAYLVLNSYPIQVLDLITGELVHSIKRQP